ncbi:RNA recognition motif domain-containing protein [Thalassotalea crassostreae]|uniref:RNA recognition motif domain-containing protein n=1 Tax=Thalassotalea crassostreae TaxID=1763536 RepID=UPI0008392E9B|nr:RNA-binding protein [Thalassotalea crassostreae]
MKSPLILTSAFVASALTAIGYFTAGAVTAFNAESIAIGLFVGAFLSPMIIKMMAGSKSSDDVKTLYVGNLPYRANESAVRELFSEHGFVHSVRLMKDKHTGKRRGFGFVEIAAADASNAIETLNDSEFQQRTLKVREAKERPEPS